MHDKHKDQLPLLQARWSKWKAQDKTKHEVPRSVNYRGTQNKNNIGTTALERSVVYTTGDLKAFHSTNFTLGPDIILNTKKLYPQPTPNCGSSYGKVTGTVQFEVFFLYPTHPSGADCFTHCNPTQGSTQTLPVILWHAHRDPPAVPLSFHQNGWRHSGLLNLLILSTQVKKGKVHRSDSLHCNPTQSSSETLSIFSLQCFHRNGWTFRGVRNFNPFLSLSLVHWSGITNWAMRLRLFSSSVNSFFKSACAAIQWG